LAHPRIQLIHAVTVAQGPIHGAFARLWPEARIVDLTEASLATDLAEAGELTDAFTDRMAALIHFGVETGADGVLFTCSAFGAAIEAARESIEIPVLKPDEAMIEAALAQGASEGSRIGGLAYMPDVSDIPQTTWELLDGLDIWVLDALRYKPHPSHVHLERSLEWIARAAPKRAVLTNMHIDLDCATVNAETPDNITSAFDGMQLTIATQ